MDGFSFAELGAVQSNTKYARRIVTLLQFNTSLCALPFALQSLIFAVCFEIAKARLCSYQLWSACTCIFG